MTNEELAVQIQLGATSLYSQLWEQVKKLMIKILFNYLASYKLPNYIDKKDMVQELYFALCKAVQAYNDTKPYKYSTLILIITYAKLYAQISAQKPLPRYRIT